LLARVTDKDYAQALKTLNIGVLGSVVVSMKELWIFNSKVPVEISHSVQKKLTDSQHNKTEDCEKQEV
jgi:hypothetical protein